VAAGGNDILATPLHLNLNSITYALRVGCIVLPVVAFVVTRRLCLSLQAADNERLAHGDETGVVVRTP
jgi:ubiquinol-cytochrome c reductase cytochrome b subunit